MAFKHQILSLIDRIGILDLYALTRREMSGSQTAVLMYHRVCPKTDNWSYNSILPLVFRQQIEYLCNHYEMVMLDEIAKFIKSGKRLPRKAIAITFDDGYSDNFSLAYPILIQYHVPATIFLTTGHISSNNLFWWDKASYILQNTVETRINLEELGTFSLVSPEEKIRSIKRINEGLKNLTEEAKNNLIQKLMKVTKTYVPDNLAKKLILSWDQIKEMNAAGISFGAHTVNHPILTNISLEQARQEIVASKQEIEEKLKTRVTCFSYPNGNYNSNIREIVKNAGFDCAVAVTPERLLSIKDDFLSLGRIVASENMNILKLELSGLLGDIHQAIGVFKKDGK
jgi:peptidoglycan/xylan/chitin deacetylase (PgdA/CDA1 family)